MAKNKKTSVRMGLLIGFGALIFLFATYGLFNLRSLGTLLGLTRTIYEHPL